MHAPTGTEDLLLGIDGSESQSQIGRRERGNQRRVHNNRRSINSFSHFSPFSYLGTRGDAITMVVGRP